MKFIIIHTAILSLIFIQVSYSNELEEEIVITGTKSKTKWKNAPVKTELIKLETKDKFKNLSSVLDQAGITQFNGHGRTGKSAIIQGLGEKHVLVLIDGVPQYQNQSDGFDLTSVDANNIKRIEIIKGASSSLYGNQAMGGVINVITEKPTRKKNFNASLRFGGNKENRQSLSFGQRSKKLKVGQQFNISRHSKENSDLDTTSVAEDSPEINKISGSISIDSNPQKKFYVWSKYSHKKEENNLISSKFFLDNGFEKLNNISEINSQNYQLGQRISLKNNAELKFIQSYDNHKEKLFLNDRISTVFKEEEKTSEQNILRLESQYSFDAFENQIWLMGLVYQDQSLSQTNKNFTETSTSTNKDIDDKAYKTTEAYLQNESMFDWGEVVPGIRLQYDQSYGTHVSPKINVLYQPKISKQFKTNIRTSVSTGYRTPTLKEKYYLLDHRSIGNYIVQGNEFLKPEKSTSYQLGGEILFNSGYSFYLNGFLNEIDDLIDVEETTDENGTLIQKYKNISNARTWGFEFNVNARVNSVYSVDLFSGYTVAKDKTNNLHLKNRPRYLAKLSQNISINKDNKINFVSSYRGDEFADEKNQVMSRGYMIYNLSYKNQSTKNTSFILEVENIFDVTKTPTADGELISLDQRPREGRVVFAGLNINI